MIHGIKLKIKSQKEKLREEQLKQPKDKNERKIKSLERSIRNKKFQIKTIKNKRIKKK